MFETKTDIVQTNAARNAFQTPLNGSAFSLSFSFLNTQTSQDSQNSFKLHLQASSAVSRFLGRKIFSNLKGKFSSKSNLWSAAESRSLSFRDSKPIFSQATVTTGVRWKMLDVLVSNGRLTPCVRRLCAKLFRKSKFGVRKRPSFSRKPADSMPAPNVSKCKNCNSR